MSTSTRSLSGGQTGFRKANEAKILEAIRIDGPSSQASLARATGLSPATITNIVRTLVTERRARSQSLNGRETLISLAEPTGTMIAINVTTGSIDAVLFDLDRKNRVSASRTNADEVASGPAVVELLIEELFERSGVAPSELASVAVGIQAPVSSESGSISSWAKAHLPAWRLLSVQDELQRRLEVAVIVENDANLAGLAEWTWGAGRGAEYFFYLMCSTHVGGAFLRRGELFRGADGLAGEIGHMVVDHTGPVCECGSRGCLTMYASRDALLAGLRGGASSTRELVQAAADGELAARGALADAGRLVGRALANVGKLIAPHVMVLGGDLGLPGSPVLESVNASLEVTSLRAVSPAVEIRAAEIGEDAVLLGGVAALLAQSGAGFGELPRWMLPQS